MKWQDKVYSVICEADKESAEDQVSKNIKRLRELGALGGKKKVGPLSPEVQQLKTDTMKLITKGRLMKSNPKKSRP
tara:strand:- start:13962 stop:14189 length:228 start_codon:yes stop_codon:yes gene_type:complete